MPSVPAEPPPANVVTCHALGLGGVVGFPGSGAGGLGFPPSGMALPPPPEVVVPPPPPGEGQAMSSSDVANTASSAPAEVNRRLDVPRWGGGGTFTVDRDDHCNLPLRIDFHLHYSAAPGINQAGSFKVKPRGYSPNRLERVQLFRVYFSGENPQDRPGLGGFRGNSGLPRRFFRVMIKHTISHTTC